MYLVNKVYLTGVDDSTDLNKLLEITKQHPYVVWGVLISESSQGKGRYPTFNTISKIGQFIVDNNLYDNFGIHVCGKPAVKGFLEGNQKYCELINPFKIVQINFRHSDYDLKLIEECISFDNRAKDIIVQYNKANEDFISKFENIPDNLKMLIDYSGGKGDYMSPVKSLEYVNELISQGVRSGIAGGFGADNINDVLSNISSTSSNSPYPYGIWIDMETKLRTDEIFDLDICTEILNCYKDFKK